MTSLLHSIDVTHTSAPTISGATRAAKDFGWTEIRWDIETIDRDEAKLMNFRLNSERGNEMKLSNMLKEDGEKWLTQIQIVDTHGISSSPPGSGVQKP